MPHAKNHIHVIFTLCIGVERDCRINVRAGQNIQILFWYDVSKCSSYTIVSFIFFFFFQAEDGIRDYKVTGVQTCALPISLTVPAYMHGSPIIVSADRAGKAAHEPPKKKEHAPRQARPTDDNKRQGS